MKRIGWFTIIFALAVGLVLFTAQVFGQNATLPQKIHQVTIDSGIKANPGTADAVVFSEWVDVGDAPWVRLLFDSVQLQGRSYLRITSLSDGGTQILHRETLAEWQNSTAYFNGPVVSVELIAAAGTKSNAVSIRRVLAGDPDPADENPSITRVCAAEDTRTPSTNAATARLLSETGGACTGFIINRAPATNRNNRCMLSAGHCFAKGAPMTVVQFDVPASMDNCSMQMPPPSQAVCYRTGGQVRQQRCG